MTAKSRATLKAENATDFPDNTARLISAADLRGQMDDIVDSALFPEDDIIGPPGPPGSGAMGLYDPQLSGAVGDGVTDDHDALLGADGVAGSAGNYLFVNKVYKVNSNLTLISGVQFGRNGRLKPAAGVTVTLVGAFSAPITQHVFDISLGGNVWATRECNVSARNYGAVSDGAGGADFNPATSLLPHGTDNRAAFQALIDCKLYFQKADAIRFDAGDYYVSGPLIINYGDGYRSIDLIGAGRRYGPQSSFSGTTIMTDWLGNLIEIQGTRMMRVVGMTLEGPFYDWVTDQGMGFAPTPGKDPYDHNSWISPAGRAAGALNRFSMSCGFHVDPRCGTKPVAVTKTDVRLVVTTPLTPTNTGNYETGDIVQGVTLALDDRILFAAPIDVDGWPGHQTNGVWTVKTAAPPVRATDMDAAAEFTNAAVTCTAGTYASQQWVCNNVVSVLAAGLTPQLGATNVDFRRFNGTLSYADYTYPTHSSIASTQYGKALSSDVTFEHCYVKGFGCAFAVKGCDADGNADFIRLEYCTSIYCAYGFAWGHGQARVFGASNSQLAWGRAAVSTAVIGRQGGKAHFSAFDSEFSGLVDILDIPTMAVAGGVTLTNGYTESGNRIGRVNTTGVSNSGFEITGGHFGTPHYNWGKVPRWIIDCDNVGVNITPHMNFGFMACPLIIKCDPRLCFIDANVAAPIWMVPQEPPVGPPANVNQAEAIMLNSTAGVLFINSNSRQGPWAGGSSNSDVWNVTAPFARSSRYLNAYTPSSVTAPIPFFATRTAPENAGTVGPSAMPIPVALGYMARNFVANGTSHIVSWSEAIVTPAAPGLPRTVLTLTLTGAFTLGTAQNCGYVPGSIILNRNSGCLYLVQTCTISTKVITAELLNNYEYATGIGYTPVVLNDSLEFYPCGHYTPNVGLELTWANASATVTYQRADGVLTDGAAQLPVGAAMMVNEVYDPLTPIIQSRSAIATSSVAGTVVFDGVARATVPVPIQRAGIFFMPRVVDI